MRRDREQIKKGMFLYAVTDRTWLQGRTLAECVEESLQGGVTFLQIREKDLDQKNFQEEAKELKELALKYQVPFVVNDNVEIAKAIDADGVHVGQSDMECRRARLFLGENKIIGVSVQTVEQAIKAEADGADYLGVGAMFETSTKENVREITKETIQAIKEAVSIPIVGIGGIHQKNVLNLVGMGLDGIAVVSAIYAASDILKATKELYSLVEQII